MTAPSATTPPTAPTISPVRFGRATWAAPCPATVGAIATPGAGPAVRVGADIAAACSGVQRPGTSLPVGVPCATASMRERWPVRTGALPGNRWTIRLSSSRRPSRGACWQCSRSSTASSAVW
ncbi:MAG: hypothetical protein IPL61_37995 [Myxococcales bacterium]|nr:hypothetical protein [Myxococcales bacterium]